MPRKKRKSTKTSAAAKKKKAKKVAAKKKAKKVAAKKEETKEEAVAEEVEEEEVSEEVKGEVKTSKVKKEAVSIPKGEIIRHGFIPIPKVWPDHLTKYEKSRIIGARALQISMGAPILIEELEKLGNPVEVAEKELEEGILPLTIRRIFPDGEIIDVPLYDLLEND